jgi:parallel beta-helix repeat protein
MGKLTRIAVFAALVSAFALGGGSALGSSKLEVDDDLAQCQQAQYTSIQAAVTAAAALPGTQRIHVCEGTYTENVMIDSSIQLHGDGAEKTFVHPVLGGPAFDATDAGRVTIEKLTVDGLSALSGNSLGIRYQQTSGLIKDVAVLNVRDSAGVFQSVGIRINSTGANVNVRVEDNRVENWTRVGVMGNGPGVTIHVEDNLIVGPIPPKTHAPNGVQISRGARALVKGNEVHDAAIGLDPPNAGSGILLFCAGRTTVEGNKIFSSDTGVNLEDNSDARVIGNEVHDSAFDAYPLLSGVAVFFDPNPPFSLGCPGGPQATANNTFEGNKAFNNGRDGVHLEGFALQPGPSDNRILNTDIKTSGRDGLRVVNGANNRFVNNTMENSLEHDAHDDQIPTPNVWNSNDCKSADPENQPGLCKM